MRWMIQRTRRKKKKRVSDGVCLGGGMQEIGLIDQMFQTEVERGFSIFSVCE